MYKFLSKPDISYHKIFIVASIREPGYRHAVHYDVFSKNGSTLPSAEAAIPLSNIEYAYGFGVYETIRAVRGKALFLGDHIERLEASAKILELQHPFKPDEIDRWTKELLQKIEADACNLKMLLIGARDPKDAALYIIPLAPLFADKRMYAKGAQAITVEHERFLPHAKALNMLPSYLAYRKAKESGCYDALFLNRHGCITEGTRTNFFTLHGKTIVSPPPAEILEGVTLKNVLAVARKQGFTIVHEPIPLSTLSTYDGAFLTSTSSKIMPLNAIDDVKLKIPDALKELIRCFDSFLDSILEKEGL